MEDLILLLCVVLIILLEDEDVDVEEIALPPPIFQGLELLLKTRRGAVPRIQGFVEQLVPFYSLDDFRSHSRLCRTTFETLLQQAVNLGGGIIPLHTHGGRPPLSVETHFLITLWVLGNQESIRSVADRFGRSKSTIWVAVRRCCRILNERLSHQVVVWPKGEKAACVMRNFEAIVGMPGVLGAIDGTHIKVKPPSDDADSYLNRLRFHSVLLQAVCDDNMFFTNCYTGWPGSCHDARVFRNSDLARAAAAAEEETSLFPASSFIIGDAAYPLKTWCMTPFKPHGGGLTHEQSRYNDIHSSTRKVIERAFRLLKGRFRKLQFLDLSVVTDFAVIIMACCVLHNICLLSDDGYTDFIIEAPLAAAAQPQLEDIFQPDTEAVARRHQLMVYLNQA